MPLPSSVRRRPAALCAVIFLGLLAGALVSGGGRAPATAAPARQQPSGGATSTPTPTATPACTPGWQQVPAPAGSGGHTRLVAVAGVADDDAWAVGHAGLPLQTLTEHWNGSAWISVPSPNGGASQNELLGVAALAPQDAWAVGYGLTNGGPFLPFLIHWTGSQWAPAPLPGTGILNGIAAVASADIWAVGHYANGTADQTLAAHWDGQAWTRVLPPNPGSGNNALYAVSARATDDVWAVGGYFDPAQNMYHSLIEHWNGSAWSVVATPDPPATSYIQLTGVLARAADDAWAVGRGAGARTLIEHWNGTAWSVVPSPNGPGGLSMFEGVWAWAVDDAWAAGWSGDPGNNQTLLAHWDGQNWSAVTSPNPSPADNWLWGGPGRAGSSLWALGSYSDPNGNELPLTIRYPAACGTPTSTATVPASSTGTATPPATLALSSTASPTAPAPTNSPASTASPTPTAPPPASSPTRT
ncbi:MAG TPA: hypothetical protein VKY74_11515, partial [Chloroflexia bacterium]|nr:hypothetical protein [Chloroflexia bacterium]